MKVTKVRIFSALALVLLASLVAAQSVRRAHMHGDGMFGGHMLHFFTEYLDLTTAQQAQIKQLIDNAKPALQPLRQQEHQSHQSMIQLITSGNFDQAKAQSIATEESQVHAQLEVQHALIASQAYQVLTPEQKTKLNAFIAKHQQRFQQHMQERGPGLE